MLSVHLPTIDSDASERFYRDALGFRRVWRHGPATCLAGPDSEVLVLTNVSRSAKVSQDFRLVLAQQDREHVLQARRRVEAFGAEVHVPLCSIGEWELFTTKDPDGHIVEVSFLGTAPLLDSTTASSLVRNLEGKA